MMNKETMYEKIMALAEDYYAFAPTGKPYKAQLNISSDDFRALKESLGKIVYLDTPNSIFSPSILNTPYGELYINEVEIKNPIITPLD